MQIGVLTCLRRLDLFERVHTSDAATAYEPLTALIGTLEHLRIGGCPGEVPPCLRQLTALRSLAITTDWVWQGDEFRAVSQALPELHQLSCLLLAPISLDSSVSWPVDVALPPVLPPGEWLASLWQLAMPASALAAHLATLTAATQLQHVAMVTSAAFEQPAGQSAVEAELRAAAAVLRWAADQLPQLRRMAVQVADEGCPRCLLCASVELQRSRPSLQLEFKDDVLSELTGDGS